MRRRTTTRRKTAPKRKATTHRRRRVSGIGKINASGILMDVAGYAGGAILAREVSNIIKKQFPTLSDTMIGGGQVVAGVLLPHFVKSKLGADLGAGMIAMGGAVLAVKLGVISGIGSDTMAYRINRVSGTNRLNVVAGTTTLPAVAGANNNFRVSNPPNRKTTF